MLKNQTRFVINFILVSLFVCGVFYLHKNGSEVKADTEQVYKDIEIFSEVLNQVEQNYVAPQESHELIYAAIKGMVRSLDPHSSFMTEEEYRELIMETKGSFTGIGIEITVKDNILTVVSPIEGTPAYKVGIKAGDKIVKVEDASTFEMTLLDAVKKIRGPKGTKIKITIMREGEPDPINFTITRGLVPLISVRHYLLTPEIGYLRISNFQSKTAKDLSAALKDLENGRELTGLILDLRNNPGGLLGQAIKVSDQFLDSGLIVSTKGRNSSQDIKAEAHKNKGHRDYPIIVLINGGSASAAEIVAGALQDNKRALIVGTKSFGKGSVQAVLPLSNGAGLRITTARYYTPSGKSIQLSGIIPDIELPFIPPNEEEEKAPRRILREEDLKGHMSEEVKKDKEDTKVNHETEKDERVKILTEKDNQVRHAINLLQSWSVFSRIKTGA